MNVNDEEYKILKYMDDEITTLVKRYKFELSKYNIDLSLEQEITLEQEKICKECYNKLYDELLKLKLKIIWKYGNITNFDSVFGEMVQKIVNRVILNKYNWWNDGICFCSRCFFVGGEILRELIVKEILRSKEEKRILTGNISGIEEEYYRLENKYISCAIVWYNEVKVLVPITHLTIKNHSKSLIRGMLGAEIDFIILEFDEIANIAIASRLEAMQLREQIEIPKLKVNDVIRVRIIAVSIKYVLVDMYGKEVIVRADKLKHTYITNCKELYKVRRLFTSKD